MSVYYYMDKRINKSKQKLKEKYIELLFKKEPEEIKVKELCSLSNINRSTFYERYGYLDALVSEIIEDEISVTVNHVMEKDHYIEFIALVSDTKIYLEKLNPEMNAQVRFKYIKGATLYAYCNKHGLWMSKIDK